MYNSLTGTISGRGPNALYLTIHGVEWEMEVSGTTLRVLATETEARVFTHLHHREDQMRLYGFATADERRVFLELTRVSGIGPRAAIKLLSAASADRLILLLETEDVDGLTALPGLGKKTAQKIILALRGKLVAGDEGDHGTHGEIIQGLIEMGFDRSQVAAAVAAIASELTDVPEDRVENEIFHKAIVRLSRE